MLKINGRSIESIIIALAIKISGQKKNYSEKKQFTKFMASRKKANEKKYKIPFYAFIKSDVVTERIDDMDVIYINKNEKKKKVLYLHGGGYVDQPFLHHLKFLDSLAIKGDVTVVLPIYPKAPNHTCIETFDKLLDLYDKMLEANSSDDITIMGDSAGGGLSLAFAQLLLEKNKIQPKNIILISPWLDVTMKNPEIDNLEGVDDILSKPGLIEIGKIWAGDLETSNHLVSPIYGNLIGLAKITLFIGTYDILLPDARKFKKIALESGVAIDYYEYEKMCHDFSVSPISEAKETLDIMIKIIKN